MITMRNQYKSLKTVYESTQEQEAINRLEKKINQLYEMLRKQTSVKGSIKSAALAAAGATFVGLVLSLSVAVYNWYIKKYAIECMKTKGLVKKKCLVKLQMSAKKQQILAGLQLVDNNTFC